MIYTVKGFNIVNEAEVEFFRNFFAFSMIQGMLAIWCLVPWPFLNLACTSGTSQFTYYWSLAWRILSITLLVCEMSTLVVWAFFGIAFLWDWNENWPFPVLWPLLRFPNLLADFPTELPYWNANGKKDGKQQQQKTHRTSKNDGTISEEVKHRIRIPEGEKNERIKIF